MSKDEKFVTLELSLYDVEILINCLILGIKDQVNKEAPQECIEATIKIGQKVLDVINA